MRIAECAKSIILGTPAQTYCKSLKESKNNC